MKYIGTPVSSGVAIGRVYLYQRFTSSVDEHPIHSESEELEHYVHARTAAQNELETLKARFLKAGDPEQAGIFSAHLEILLDETLDEEIREKVAHQHVNGPWAIQSIYERYASVFEKLDNPIIRERATDLRDVSSRLLRCWDGLPEQNLSSLPSPVIIVAKELIPSDTATLDRSNVLAIVTEAGGNTSHSAIIARSYEIPALLGVAGITEVLENGQQVIVDAVDGALISEFDSETKGFYAAKRAKVLERWAQARCYLGKKPVTTDGVSIDVELNLASADPQNLEGAKYTDGVGLFRSEFLYMGRKNLPDEEEQFQTYRKVLMTYGKRPVTLRTLDIGGDKPLECMDLPKEDNPFLGNRALRLCFQHPDIFRTQLRAALRASVYGTLWLMFPMVSSMDDIFRAKKYVQDTMKELRAENVPYDPNTKIGIMVEIPSIALLADQAAKEVDFASIGTNDLTQYSIAVDRGNPDVSQYYQTYHPALFRLIGYVIQEFTARGKPVGVCGEMGGDPLAAAVLIGLGIRRLSMGFSSVAPMKQMICSLDAEKARFLAKTVCGLPTADSVKRFLSENVPI